MLQTLKELFGALQPPAATASAQAAEHTLQLATAVMLIEVMRADTHFDAAERRAVVDALRAKFALADDETARLIELAEQARRDATDWFEFTSHINAHFDMAAKIRMVEYMWRVAYADGHLSEHERHTLWRLSDLLHVPHGAYIHAKMRAKDAAGA
ncbi:MAG: TerB family tellurite resistance protein [Rubrivivax sp.]